MIREPIHFRETFATILADEAKHIAAAKAGILAARQELEAYLARDPFLEPRSIPASRIPVT
jgi:uncharacterized protein